MDSPVSPLGGGGPRRPFLFTLPPLGRAARARLKGKSTPEHAALRDALGAEGSTLLARMTCCEKTKLSRSAPSIELGWRADVSACATSPLVRIPQSGDTSGGNVGAVLWDCAAALYTLIEAPARAGTRGEAVCTMRGKRVLELGSGTGLVGIAAARAGALRVLLTDNHNLDALCTNVDANTHRSADSDGAAEDDAAACDAVHSAVGDAARVAPLDWHASDAAALDALRAAHFGGCDPDVIIASDVMYARESSMAFVALLERLVPPGAVDVTVLLAYKHRHAGLLTPAWERLRASFDVEELRSTILDTLYEHCQVGCYALVRPSGCGSAIPAAREN